MTETTARSPAAHAHASPIPNGIGRGARISHAALFSDYTPAHRVDAIGSASPSSTLTTRGPMKEHDAVTAEIFEGGCRCGAVRYRLTLAALPRSYACHCHQCQRWSGSAFSQNLFVPEKALSVTGPLLHYDLTTADRTSHQHLCANCHARVYNTNTRRPGIAVVRAGTLDRSEELTCALHIYTSSKQAWVVLPDGAMAFPEAAPVEAMIAALQV